MVAPLSLLVSLAAASVEVSGAATCPSAQEVEAKLAPLLRKDDGGPPYLARVDPVADGVRLEMRTADGWVVGHRVVSAEKPCSELASALAVMIAAWEAQLRPGRPPAPMPRRGPGPPEVAAASRRGPAFELGAAIHVATAGGSLAPGGGAYGSAGPERGLGWHAALSASAPRELPFGPGSIRWHRIGLAAGPQLRLPWRAMHFDLQALAAVALLSVAGVAYTENEASLGLDAGAGLGLRLAWPGGRFIPSLAFSAIRWLPGQRARVEGIEGGADIPRLELLLSAGLAVGAL